MGPEGLPRTRPVWRGAQTLRALRRVRPQERGGGARTCDGAACHVHPVGGHPARGEGAGTGWQAEQRCAALRVPHCHGAVVACSATRAWAAAGGQVPVGQRPVGQQGGHQRYRCQAPTSHCREHVVHIVCGREQARGCCCCRVTRSAVALPLRSRQQHRTRAHTQRSPAVTRCLQSKLQLQAVTLPLCASLTWYHWQPASAFHTITLPLASVTASL